MPPFACRATTRAPVNIDPIVCERVPLGSRPHSWPWSAGLTLAVVADRYLDAKRDLIPRQPTFGSPDSRKEPPESAKRNKTRGEISRKYGVNCSRSVADPLSAPDTRACQN